MSKLKKLVIGGVLTFTVACCAIVPAVSAKANSPTTNTNEPETELVVADKSAVEHILTGTAEQPVIAGEMSDESTTAGTETETETETEAEAKSEIETETEAEVKTRTEVKVEPEDEAEETEPTKLDVLLEKVESEEIVVKHGDWFRTAEQIQNNEAVMEYMYDGQRFAFREYLEDVGAENIQFQYLENATSKLHEDVGGVNNIDMELNFTLGENLYHVVTSFYPADSFTITQICVTTSNGDIYFAINDYEYRSFMSGREYIGDEPPIKHTTSETRVRDVEENFFTDWEYLGYLTLLVNNDPLDGTSPFKGLMPCLWYSGQDAAVSRYLDVGGIELVPFYTDEELTAID